MLSEELRPYRKALIDAGMSESLALVQRPRGGPRAEFQRLDAYQALARVQADGGDLAAAIETTRKAIALAESLVSRDPAAIRPRIALAASLHRPSVDLAGRAVAPRGRAAVQRDPAVDPDARTPSSGTTTRPALIGDESLQHRP